MNSAEELRRVISNFAPCLQPKVPWADATKLLVALAEVESSFAYHSRPRHERAYDRGGKYFNVDLNRLYGSFAACSVSSFQIMYPVAVELGLPTSVAPWELHRDCVAMPWVLAYIDKRILSRGWNTLETFADAYNTGDASDENVPTKYVEKFVRAYQVADQIFAETM